MDTVKIENKGHTLMIAHRGLSGIERENTIPAFVAAGNRSYFGEECDVHLSKDGKYLICHDSETGRIANADIIIEESTFDAVRELYTRESGDDGKISAMMKIPTLSEYLAVMKRYQKVAVIELKGIIPEQHLRNIIEICRTEYTLEKVIFISFLRENLVVVRKLLPNQPLQFLTCEPPADLVQFLKNYKLDLDIGFWLLDEQFVKDVHREGIKVNCWTCDEPDKARELIDWGVDFITTNILE